MQKMIMVKPMECAGCRTCEVVCSLSHHGVCSPIRSNIRVVEWLDVGLCSPFTCLQCQEPMCLKACPVNAIKRDDGTGAVVVNDQLCVGCRLCVLACPVGGSSINIDTGKMIKCDLCGGDPLCVKMCPTGAITFVDVGEVPLNKRRAGAAFLLSEMMSGLKTCGSPKPTSK